MKIRLLAAISFALISLVFAISANGQGTSTLYVLDMPGFPDLPGDSAYEGPIYTFDIVVVNNTNTFVNSTVTFNMKVDTTNTLLFSNPQTAIAPGDTVSIVATYNFTQPVFKMGNNIVVVWPVVNGLVVPVDTFHTAVHFIPLNSLGGEDVFANSFKLFPIPSSQYLYLEIKDLTAVEYVRIFNTTGQLVSDRMAGFDEAMDISFLRPGIYYLEIFSKGKTTRKKFIRQG